MTEAEAFERIKERTGWKERSAKDLRILEGPGFDIDLHLLSKPNLFLDARSLGFGYIEASMWRSFQPSDLRLSVFMKLFSEGELRELEQQT